MWIFYKKKMSPKKQRLSHCGKLKCEEKHKPHHLKNKHVFFNASVLFFDVRDNWANGCKYFAWLMEDTAKIISQKAALIECHEQCTNFTQLLPTLDGTSLLIRICILMNISMEDVSTWLFPQLALYLFLPFARLFIETFIFF